MKEKRRNKCVHTAVVVVSGVEVWWWWWCPLLSFRPVVSIDNIATPGLCQWCARAHIHTVTRYTQYTAVRAERLSECVREPWKCERNGDGDPDVNTRNSTDEWQ